jgi:hypothetical protein
LKLHEPDWQLTFWQLPALRQSKLQSAPALHTLPSQLPLEQSSVQLDSASHTTWSH